MSITEEFSSVKDLVSNILESNPHTRNSDTYLYQECCKKLGAKTVDDISKIDLNMITVHKARQVIQNKEGKYSPDENVRNVRSIRAEEIRDYMSNN